MQLSYDEFMSLVPEETREFLKLVLAWFYRLEERHFRFTVQKNGGKEAKYSTLELTRESYSTVEENYEGRLLIIALWQLYESVDSSCFKDQDLYINLNHTVKTYDVSHSLQYMFERLQSYNVFLNEHDSKEKCTFLTPFKLVDNLFKRADLNKLFGKKLFIREFAEIIGRKAHLELSSTEMQERVLKLLEEEQTTDLVLDNYASIANYGFIVSDTYEAVIDYFRCLQADNTSASYVTHANSLTTKLYPAKNPLVRIFRKSKPLDYEVLASISKELDTALHILEKDLKSYNFICNYLTIYLDKIRCYSEKVSSLADSLQLPEGNNPANQINYSTLKTLLEEKEAFFRRNVSLIQTVLLQVNQAILNHFRTITTLQVSRETLIPLIESHRLIVNGSNNSKQALMTSKYSALLLHFLLSGNVEQSKATLDKLKQISLTADDENKINNLAAFFEGIEPNSSKTEENLLLKP